MMRQMTIAPHPRFGRTLHFPQIDTYGMRYANYPRPTYSGPGRAPSMRGVGSVPATLTREDASAAGVLSSEDLFYSAAATVGVNTVPNWADPTGRDKGLRQGALIVRGSFSVLTMLAASAFAGPKTSGQSGLVYGVELLGWGILGWFKPYVGFGAGMVRGALRRTR